MRESQGTTLLKFCTNQKPFCLEDGNEEVQRLTEFKSQPQQRNKQQAAGKC